MLRRNVNLTWVKQGNTTIDGLTFNKPPGSFPAHLGGLSAYNHMFSSADEGSHWVGTHICRMSFTPLSCSSCCCLLGLFHLSTERLMWHLQPSSLQRYIIIQYTNWRSGCQMQICSTQLIAVSIYVKQQIQEVLVRTWPTVLDDVWVAT